MPDRIVTPRSTDGYDDPELVRQLRQTVEGMAHFAATGPFGCCCGDCSFYGYRRVHRSASGEVTKTSQRRKCCGKFFKLTGSHGPPIPPNTEACRHFLKGEEPSR